MAILHLEINNQTLTASCDIEKIVENSVKYLQFDLKCSSDWDDLTKAIIFTYNGKDITATDDFVPPHILRAPGFTVSVNGYTLSDETSESDENIVKRITTSPVSVNVYPSGALNGTIVPEEELASDWLTSIQNTINSVANTANDAKNIAENAVIKEDGKGLSTNDFTTEEKQKLENALLPENIDQTYSATSENAQSGKAVAEALKTIVKDLEQVPLESVDKWEHNRIYKNIEPEFYVVHNYVFDDGTSKSMGVLLPISIVVKTSHTIYDTQAIYEEDIVYNFDGQHVIEWRINPFYKSITSHEFVPITEISETATNNNYPTALAVKNFVVEHTSKSIDQTYSPESINAQSGVAVAEAVAAANTYTDGKVMRLINSIAVPAEETASILKITKDLNNTAFSLNHIMFSIKLIISEAQTVTIRLRTDTGQRYLVYKTKVSSNTILFISGDSKVFSLGTYTNACYKSTDADLSGMSEALPYCNLATNNKSKTNISNIEIFLYDTSNNMVPLLAGSSIELWGC